VNFLGHFWLDGGETNLRIGNFIADGVKGKRYLEYPKPIQNGILLHRFIDSYTDTNEHVLKGVRKLYTSAGKFAPVVSDILLDHVLAKHWVKFHAQPLEQFAEDSYRILRDNQQYFSVKTLLMLDFMENHNWLVNYAKPEGFKRSVLGLANRVSFPKNLESCVDYCINNIEEFVPNTFLFLENIRKESIRFKENLEQ